MESMLGTSEVAIKCRQCKAEYAIRRRDLAKTAHENDGYVPCYFCGSRNTTWESFRKEEDEYGRK